MVGSGFQHLFTAVGQSIYDTILFRSANNQHEIIYAADRSGLEGKPVRLPL